MGQGRSHAWGPGCSEHPSPRTPKWAPSSSPHRIWRPRTRTRTMSCSMSSRQRPRSVLQPRPLPTHPPCPRSSARVLRPPFPQEAGKYFSLVSQTQPSLKLSQMLDYAKLSHMTFKLLVRVSSPQNHPFCPSAHPTTCQSGPAPSSARLYPRITYKGWSSPCPALPQAPPPTQALLDSSRHSSAPPQAPPLPRPLAAPGFLGAAPLGSSGSDGLGCTVIGH